MCLTWGRSVSHRSDEVDVECIESPTDRTRRIRVNLTVHGPDEVDVEHIESPTGQTRRIRVNPTVHRLDETTCRVDIKSDW